MSNLDMVHVGFALEKNGRIHLLHASSKNMKVEISELPLSNYFKANKSQSGIIIGRLTGKLCKRGNIFKQDRLILMTEGERNY